MLCPTCAAERETEDSPCAGCGAPALTLALAPTFSSNSIPASPQPARSPGRRSVATIDHGAFMPGAVLAGRYRIVGLLGRGGMGEVYRADDLMLGQTVALKFLRAGADDEGDLTARLRDETRTARQVSHPNVCRVHDVGEWAGRPFVSMEYVDGEDLASLLRRIGRLSPDKALEIVRQVCAGLAAAHDRDVLHRDLKPANVMLDGRGKVRLTDFGLASFASDDHIGEIAGTPAYMAPEQVAGGKLSPQTDLYAVGLLLFELLSGTAVYGTTSFAERRQQGIQPPPQLPTSARAGIEPRVVQVIDRCLDPDPARRPHSALAIAAALPGGDPLAAALAAGETPAPHMIADAPDSNALTAVAALACLLAFGAGIVALLAVNGLNVYSRYVAFRYSPEVLAAKAEEMRERLGYNDAPVDTARGFTTRVGYLPWYLARRPGAPQWEHLQSLRPQLVVFWHRSSPHPLVKPVIARFGGAPFTIAASSAQPITAIDATELDPGASYLELDPDGALSGLMVMPSNDSAPTTVNGQFEWTRLFTEARLDAATFSRVETLPTVPMLADARAAWTGLAPDGSGVTLRIEAASFAGRPVYFKVSGPWAPAAPPSVSTETVIVTLVFFMLVAVGAVLARRHVQHGKSDQQGALRLAAAVGLVLLAAQLLEAHHTLTGAEAFLVTGACSWALFVAAFSWLTYVALEPYVRRHWPHALIGWTRLLAGRWRDRRVGSDMLIGAVGGLAGVVIDRAAYALSGWRTGDSVLWRVDLDALSSVGSLLAACLRSLAMSTAFPIVLLFLLLLLRLSSPRAWLAPTLAVAMLVGLTLSSVTDPLVQLPLVIASTTIPVWLLTRYGLLAGATSFFVDAMCSWAIVSLDMSPFFASTMLAGVLLLSVPAVAGFLISVRGRPLAGRRFALDDGLMRL